MGLLSRLFRLACFAAAVLALVAALILVGLYRHYVIAEPGSHLERAYIMQLISQESPVYYRDGETQLGVFFADEHRQYLAFEELPKHFVDALVAAEDQDFWEHGGFSPSGIARAMVSNIRAGRVVAGGSTLTQQTAKNLFKRRGRTFKEKLRELGNALRLEAFYSKQDILEFYSNQFYVNGNGRGLSIAARFFFDREVAELGLLECAFLAGVVKSPNRYNPWVAGAERRSRAIAAAHARARYVLGRMLADGAIDSAAHSAALAAEIPFQRGHFRFQRSVVLDEIERELDSPFFQELLAAHGIGNFATSGLQVTSTLDPVAQRGANYGLRHHLTRAGTWLEAPELAALFLGSGELRPADPERLVARSFHTAVLRSIDRAAGTAELDLGGVRGTVDREGNLRLARMRRRAERRNLWVDARKKDLNQLLGQLEEFIGQRVVVSVREVDGKQLVLDWEWQPALQGAVLVLDRGVPRALVGGVRNMDFNRAMMARRQLGSTWKPLLFAAALQLRWATTDPLDNRRAVFPYQGWFYYPRPDHKGAPDFVSMAWASAKSENLASIWLLSRLTDRLNPEQLRQLVERVGLARGASESRRDFVRRVQQAGVVASSAKLVEGLFEQARAEALVDLEFAAAEEQSEALQGLFYGLGVEAELARLEDDEDVEDKEKQLRRALLQRNFLAQEELAERFDEQRAALLAAIEQGESGPGLPVDGFYLMRDAQGAAQLSYGEPAARSSMVLQGDQFEELLAGRGQTLVATLGPVEARPDENSASSDRREATAAFEPRPGLDEADRLFLAEGEEQLAQAGFDVSRRQRAEQLLSAGQVMLQGQLSVALVKELRLALDQALAELGPVKDLYAAENLLLCRDFRTLVSLRYLRLLAEASGVESEIREVMSLPLGSSELTLMEAARLYEVMHSGSRWQVVPDLEGMGTGSGAAESVAAQDAIAPLLEPAAAAPAVRANSMIAELRSATGELIYRARPQATGVQEQELSLEMAAMLRAVVQHGTGRRAQGKVRARSSDAGRAAELRALDARVPLFGKTGTTNAYRNSAFLGVVPGIAAGEDRLAWEPGQVVATYVGYDDNREMKRGAIRVAGASGSLPVWIEAAQAVVEAERIGDRVDLADLAFGNSNTLPLDWPDSFVGVSVDSATGLPLDGDRQGSGPVIMQGAVQRRFAPFLSEVAADVLSSDDSGL